jgi:G3E family GTPase
MSAMFESSDPSLSPFAKGRDDDDLDDEPLDDDVDLDEDEDDPKTIGLSYEGELKKEELTKFLDSVSKDCYRIKGFFKLEDGWNQVDVVNNKIDYRLSNTPENESTLVFISKIGPNVIRNVNDSWNDIIGKPMKLSN